MGNTEVYLLLADGFEEIEALTPVDLLRRCGASVTTVGITGKTVTGAHGITVTADVTPDGGAALLADGKRPAMLILPGGMPGTKQLDASPVTDLFLSAALEENAYIGAICAAPMILGKRGLLRGKNAVCYPGFEETLSGATVCTVPAVRDGKIITGRAMGAAAEFSFLLAEALFGKDRACTLREEVLA